MAAIREAFAIADRARAELARLEAELALDRRWGICALKREVLDVFRPVLESIPRVLQRIIDGEE